MKRIVFTALCAFSVSLAPGVYAKPTAKTKRPVATKTQIPVKKVAAPAAAAKPVKPLAPAKPLKDPQADHRLIMASLQGDPAGIEWALSRGADINVRELETGNTALINAIYRDTPDIVELLIVKGADVNQAARDGSTGLMAAASGGQMQLVERLIEKGAKIDAQQQDGYTALMWAAYWGHKPVVRYLLDQGANAQLSSKDGQTSLMLATEGSLRKQSQYALERSAKRNLKTHSGESIPVPPPVFNGEGEMLEMLIARGADVNAQTASGTTALHQAVSKGAYGMVQVLLQAKANPGLTDQKGRSAIDQAQELKHGYITRLLKRSQQQSSL